MTVRTRLILSLVVVLLVSLSAGGFAAGWHAHASVAAEMRAALAVGGQTVRNAIAELAPDRDDALELRRVVRSFDGDRHVRAVLREADGSLREASTVLAPRPMPDWFVAWLTPALDPLELRAGSAGTVVLEPDPRNEIAEVWTQLRDEVVAVGLFCGLSLALVTLVATRALRPLGRLAGALDAVAEGDYAVRVRQSGPPELARLAAGFNAMAAGLEAAQAQNRRLTDQVVTLQEEERADLARDLHDEVGPFLFAVQLDAAAIETAVRAGRAADVPERAHAIREAVGHMQKQVRAMLLRLRPASPLEVGLGPALGNLVAFWRARLPHVIVTLDVAAEEQALDEPRMAAIYRLVQEGLNNAIRHGRPGHVTIAVTSDAVGTVTVRIADDGNGLGPEPGTGLGLAGMRERAAALGGTLEVRPGPAGAGLEVVARLPDPARGEQAA